MAETEHDIIMRCPYCGGRVIQAFVSSCYVYHVVYKNGDSKILEGSTTKGDLKDEHHSYFCGECKKVLDDDMIVNLLQELTEEERSLER